MKTRSQTRIIRSVENQKDMKYEQNKEPLFQVNIDFDESSREWIKNKKRIGNGMYVYKNKR